MTHEPTQDLPKYDEVESSKDVSGPQEANGQAEEQKPGETTSDKDIHTLLMKLSMENLFLKKQIEQMTSAGERPPHGSGHGDPFMLMLLPIATAIIAGLSTKLGGADKKYCPHCGEKL